MRRSYQTRKLERHSRKPAELLLVPMIDIFTVLVTFLLMTAVFSRSEEHTSELQSQSNLVCRLLLEKKKKRIECRTGLGTRYTKLRLLLLRLVSHSWLS